MDEFEEEEPEAGADAPFITNERWLEVPAENAHDPPLFF
jgi:hypothetical protein